MDMSVDMRADAWTDVRTDVCHRHARRHADTGVGAGVGERMCAGGYIGHACKHVGKRVHGLVDRSADWQQQKTKLCIGSSKDLRTDWCMQMQMWCAGHVHTKCAQTCPRARVTMCSAHMSILVICGQSSEHISYMRAIVRTY